MTPNMLIKDAWDLTYGITFNDELGFFYGDVAPTVADIHGASGVPDGSLYLEVGGGLWHKRLGIWTDISLNISPVNAPSNAGVTYIGVPANGDHTSVSGTGHLTKNGSKYWDNLNAVTTHSALTDSIFAPQPLKIMQPTGITPGTSLGFNGIDSTVQIPASNLMLFNNSDLSVGFWVNPTVASLTKTTILSKRKSWLFGIRNGFPYVDLKKGGKFISAVAITPNTSSCLVFTLGSNIVTGTLDIVIYMNNIAVLTVQLPQLLIDTRIAPVFIGSQDGRKRYFGGTLDQLSFWNSVLTPAEVAIFYNNGAGVSTLGIAGGIAPNFLVANYTFNNPGTSLLNSQGTPALDILLPVGIGAPTVNPGIINSEITGGSSALGFLPNRMTEVFFSVQLPHGWVPGTNIFPQIHWNQLDIGTGNIEFGIEYSIADINSVYPAVIKKTTIGVAGVINKHVVTNFATPISGTGANISSLIVGRLFRQGDSINDTFNGAIVLSKLDFHIELDSIGSSTELVK